MICELKFLLLVALQNHLPFAFRVARTIFRPKQYLNSCSSKENWWVGFCLGAKPEVCPRVWLQFSFGEATIPSILSASTHNGDMEPGSRLRGRVIPKLLQHCFPTGHGTNTVYSIKKTVFSFMKTLHFHKE